jgi:uncharacterized membrane protein
MRRAVDARDPAPVLALVDGNRAPRLRCAVETLVRGDALDPAISAASILAKTARDASLLELHAASPTTVSTLQGYPTVTRCRVAPARRIAGAPQVLPPGLRSPAQEVAAVKIAVFFHVLGVVVWVGGMFFAYLALRPAAAQLLEPPQRLALWQETLRRFFNWVWFAVVLVLASGLWMLFQMGGFAGVPVYVHAMLLLGLVMMAIRPRVLCALPALSTRRRQGLLRARRSTRSASALLISSSDCSRSRSPPQAPRFSDGGPSGDEAHRIGRQSALSVLAQARAVEPRATQTGARPDRRCASPRRVSRARRQAAACARRGRH